MTMNRQTYAERKEARRRDEARAQAIVARGPLELPPDELVRVRWLLETAAWIFARTMPKNPHWYTLRRQWENDNDFVFVVQFIRRYGLVERFPDPVKGWPYIYFDLDGFHYWTMGDELDATTLINRKPLACPTSAAATLSDAVP
jgi:hypothetical protein